MNLSANLDSIDLTTLARVRELTPHSVSDTSMDSVISRLITDVSMAMGRYMGLHLDTASRTEIYELRKHSRVLTLDAKNVSAITSIKENPSIPDDWSTIAAIDDSNYVLNTPGGWVRFLKNRANDPGFLQVIYSGGFGAAASNVITDFPDLAQGCEIQVKYLLERLSTIGGDISTGEGGGTQFGNAYGWHRQTMDVMSHHRRGTA